MRTRWTFIEVKLNLLRDNHPLDRIFPVFFSPDDVSFLLLFNSLPFYPFQPTPSSAYFLHTPIKFYII